MFHEKIILKIHPFASFLQVACDSVGIAISRYLAYMSVLGKAAERVAANTSVTFPYTSYAYVFVRFCSMIYMKLIILSFDSLPSFNKYSCTITAMNCTAYSILDLLLFHQVFRLLQGCVQHFQLCWSCGCTGCQDRQSSCSKR